MSGKTVCYHHGGKSLSGIAQPQFKTGKYSKHLPTRLVARYEEAEADPDMLSLRSEMALLDARLAELLTDMSDEGQAVLWGKLERALLDLRYANQQKDSALFAKSMAVITAMIERGSTEAERWRQIQETIEQRRKLAESETKRLTTMQQMVTIERLMVFIGAVMGVLREHVSDRQQLQGIVADIDRLVESGR